MKTFKELLESAPVGSFDDLRSKVSDQLDQLANAAPFIIKFSDGVPMQMRPWIVHMFTDSVVVEWMSELYQIKYKVSKKGEVKMSTPTRVTQVFEPVKETKTETKLSDELKEANITVTKAGTQTDSFEVANFISLKESTFDSEAGILEVILIEAGTSDEKKRHYPVSTIKEAAPLFSGLKMYIDHPTADDERKRPERSIKDWASTILESRHENGKAVAKIAVHDTWLRERLSDPVFREHVGLSILAGGQIAYGNVNGQEMQIVEKIVMHRRNGPASVDWVTEAGARGRVSRLLKECKTGEKRMELNEATFEDLQRENPKLVKSLKESIVNELKESDEAKKKEQELKEAKEENQKLKEASRKAEQTSKINAWLAEATHAKLPKAAKERVASQLVEAVFETEEALKEAFGAAVKKENEYINQLSDKGRIKLSGDTGAQQNGTLRESMENDLASRLGVAEEKPAEKK